VFVRIRDFCNYLINGVLVERIVTLSFKNVCLEIARQAVSFFFSMRGFSEEYTNEK
jgi:hypothetical protein